MTQSTRTREIYRVTLVGSVGNIVLTLFKFIAGFLGHSSAMIADAVHSLSDFISDIVVLVFVKLSSKPQDVDHDYGHGKYETLATVIVGVLLILTGAWLFYNGARDVISAINGNVLDQPGLIALIAAIVSILVKEGLYQYTVRKGRKLNSSVVIANAWHHRSDAISSIATLVGIGGAIALGAGWRVLDPIAAMLVSIFIVKVAISLTKPALGELMEKSLPAEVEQEIIKEIETVKGVGDPHHLRTRRIGNNLAIDVHIRMDGDLPLKEAHAMASEVEKRLREKFGKDTFVSLHLEPKK